MSETLESLVDGFNTMAPVEVRGHGSVCDGICHPVQEDLADTVGEH